MVKVSGTIILPTICSTYLRTEATFCLFENEGQGHLTASACDFLSKGS